MSKPTNIQAALWRYRGSLNKKFNGEFYHRPNLRYMYLDGDAKIVEDMSKAQWIIELSFKNIIMGSAIYRIHRYTHDSITVVPPCKKRSYEFIFIVGYCYAMMTAMEKKHEIT